MIGPTEVFADLLAYTIDSRLELDADPCAPAEYIEMEIALALERHELQRQQDELVGQHLILPYREGGAWKRKLLDRTPLYSIAPPDEIITCAIDAHIAYISKQHGPGRVWFLLEPVHLIENAGRFRACVLADLPGPNFFLRTIYGHEAQAREA